MWKDQREHFRVVCPATLPGPGFDNHVLMMQAALTGGGVALGWTGTARDFVRKHQLVEVLPDEIDVDGGLYLVTKLNSYSSSAQKTFAKWLLEQAGGDKVGVQEQTLHS